jgi:hypothetical protein
MPAVLTSSSSGRLRDWIHRVNAGWDRRGDIVSLTESIRRSHSVSHALLSAGGQRACLAGA